MSTRKLIILSAVALAWLGTAFAQLPGKLTVEPSGGPVGASVTATATDLTPGAPLLLVWMGADAAWNVHAADGTFHGITANETRTVVARATADGEGAATFVFSAPEGYGYVHNLFVEADDAEAGATASGGGTAGGGAAGDAATALARSAFTVAPSMTINPTSGPVGTPITITFTGIGYRFWEVAWHLLYDGAHSGWVSGVTTGGTAVFTLPATGEVGPHTLQALSGTHPVPYLNQQQSPIYKPAVPTVISAVFDVTEGAAVRPAGPASMTLPREGTAALTGGGASLTAAHASGPVGSPIELSGKGFPAASAVTLSWTTVTGNRISGNGWDESESELRQVQTDADGAFALTISTPDDLGGEHTLRATAGEARASLRYRITPSVSEVSPQVVAPGGDITLTLKGVGWTQTANIYTLLLDNGYVGYGCGFNSQGDVTIHLKAPGRPGTHFIGLYPAIYQGELSAPGGPSTPDANATFLQLPMLNAVDHPGEALPVFQLAFEVRADVARAP